MNISTDTYFPPPDSRITNESTTAFYLDDQTSNLTTWTTPLPPPAEHSVYFTVFDVTLVLLMAVSGVGGNALVIWWATTFKRLSASVNVYVINLAVSDCLFGIALIAVVPNLITHSNAIGGALCRFIGSFCGICIVASLYTQTSIAICRFRHVVRGGRRRPSVGLVVEHATGCSAGIAAAMWLLATATIMPMIGLFGDSMSRVDFNLKTHACSNVRDGGLYVILLVVIGFGLPLVVSAVFYVLIYCTVAKSRLRAAAAAGSAAKRRREAAGRDARVAAGLSCRERVRSVCYCCWSDNIDPNCALRAAEITIVDAVDAASSAATAVRKKSDGRPSLAGLRKQQRQQQLGDDEERSSKELSSSCVATSSDRSADIACIDVSDGGGCVGTTSSVSTGPVGIPERKPDSLQPSDRRATGGRASSTAVTPILEAADWKAPRASGSRASSRAQDRAKVRMALIILVSYVMCFGLYFVVNVGDSRARELPMWVHKVSAWCVYLHCCVNPIVYGLTNHQFWNDCVVTRRRLANRLTHSCNPFGA